MTAVIELKGEFIKEIFLSLIFLFSLIICFSLNALSQTTQTNKVDELVLDKTEALLPCSFKRPYKSECFGKDTIKVKTNVFSHKGKLKFQYSVSGGRIIGNGKKVNWDLSFTRPGNYKISVTVSDGHDFIKTLIKYINLLECTACREECLVCPVVLIQSSTETVTRDREITFTTDISLSRSDAVFTYKWKVSNGKIIKGKNSSEIIVKANKFNGKDLTVIVEIGGSCDSCEKNFTKTVKIVRE